MDLFVKLIICTAAPSYQPSWITSFKPEASDSGHDVGQQNNLSDLSRDRDEVDKFPTDYNSREPERIKSPDSSKVNTREPTKMSAREPIGLNLLRDTRKARDGQRESRVEAPSQNATPGTENRPSNRNSVDVDCSSAFIEKCHENGSKFRNVPPSTEMTSHNVPGSRQNEKKDANINGMNTIYY